LSGQRARPTHFRRWAPGRPPADGSIHERRTGTHRELPSPWPGLLRARSRTRSLASMKSLWSDKEAAGCEGDPLRLRVYTSRLLGQEPSLVLHGGGNTSVKATGTSLFGEREDLLYIKGSGWDLATIEAAGFAPVRLPVLTRMAELPRLTDTEMVRAQ